MSRRVKEQILELEIADVSKKKGFGVSTFTQPDGKVCKVEVPFCLAGEVVSAKLTSKSRGVYQGLLLQVIRPSNDRAAPKCFHFGTCGGCRFQHASYERQLKIKEGIVKDYFSGLTTGSTRINPIVPCDPVWGYRNKMEFSFSSDAEKNRYLGLVKMGGKGRVFNLRECHLPGKWFVETLKAVKQWWDESNLDAYHVHRNTGSLRTLTLREGKNTGDRMIILTVSGNPDYALKRHQIDGFIAFVRDAALQVEPDMNLSVFLRIHQAIKGRPTNLYDMHIHGEDFIRETLHVQTDKNGVPEPLIFKISPQAFFQPNTRQAETLYSLALQMAGISRDDSVFDLYCGTGVLGLCAAKIAKEVVGIELSIEAVEDARINAEQNGLNNAAIYAGDVGKVLKRIDEEKLHAKPTIVLLDPPRAGLDSNALGELIKLSPEKILYVSCNPKTQAENIEYFLNHGYMLSALTPVDQFPHTIHIENIALLTKVLS